MYLVNTTITVNWEIPATVITYLLEDFDISIKPPDRISTYIDNAILAENYLAPTPTTDGLVAYDFTPDEVGLWTITLSSGTGAAHVEFYSYKILVSKNDLYTRKKIKRGLI